MRLRYSGTPTQQGRHLGTSGVLRHLRHPAGAAYRRGLCSVSHNIQAPSILQAYILPCRALHFSRCPSGSGRLLNLKRMKVDRRRFWMNKVLKNTHCTTSSQPGVLSFDTSTPRARRSYRQTEKGEPGKQWSVSDVDTGRGGIDGCTVSIIFIVDGEPIFIWNGIA